MKQVDASTWKKFLDDQYEEHASRVPMMKLPPGVAERLIDAANKNVDDSTLAKPKVEE